MTYSDSHSTILEKVLATAAAERDGIGDSDLDDEQSVTVMLKTTLGELRAAGLGLIAGYREPVRPRIGVRVKRAKPSRILSPFGTVAGWDADLSMLLVQWDFEQGPEAVTPDEYAVIL